LYTCRLANTTSKQNDALAGLIPGSMTPTENGMRTIQTDCFHAYEYAELREVTFTILNRVLVTKHIGFVERRQFPANKSGRLIIGYKTCILSPVDITVEMRKSCKFTLDILDREDVK